LIYQKSGQHGDNMAEMRLSRRCKLLATISGVGILIIFATTTSLLVTNNNARKSSTNNATVVVQIIDDQHASSNNSLSTTINNNSKEEEILSLSPSSQPQIVSINPTVVEETPLLGDIVEVLAATSILSTWNAAILATGLNLSTEGESGGFGCGHIFTVFGIVSLHIFCSIIICFGVPSH
jgi:hypothetical protein